MAGWPQFGQNIVRAIIGTEAGPASSTTPIPVTPVGPGGGAATTTANQGTPGVATAPWPVVPSASATAEGFDPYFNNALSAAAAVVKATAGVLYAAEVSNPNTADVFLQIFNVPAASVNLGTTVPVWSLLVPAGVGALNRSAMDKMWLTGLKLGGTGISVAATTTPTGAVAPASAVTCNLGYK